MYKPSHQSNFRYGMADAIIKEFKGFLEVRVGEIGLTELKADPDTQWYIRRTFLLMVAANRLYRADMEDGDAAWGPVADIRHALPDGLTLADTFNHVSALAAEDWPIVEDWMQ